MPPGRWRPARAALSARTPRRKNCWTAVETILSGGTAIEKDVAAEMALHDLAEDAYLRPLTERDLEILRLLSAGDSLSEIADKLGIAYKTVANTLSRIKEKLGVGQTSELIRIAVGRGLADRV